MGFRDNKGNIVGDENHYSYKGKIGKNSQSSYKIVIRLYIIFIVSLFVASIFMFCKAFFGERTDISDNLFSGILLAVLAIYISCRLKRYKKREKIFEENLHKYKKESNLKDYDI